MNIGDLVKRKNKEWYALVIGFKKTFPAMGYILPDGDTNYPVIMWLAGNSGSIDSCHRSLLEVISECHLNMPDDPRENEL